MNTSNLSDQSQDILAQMGQIPAIVQGKVSERRNGGKVTGFKLQRWRNGRNETRHIPAQMVQTVREGTDGYARLTQLVQHYVELREDETLSGHNAGKKKLTRQ